MILAQFKKQQGISDINLFKSSKSNRMVGSFTNIDGRELKVITCEDVDLSKDLYVYSAPEALDAVNTYFISNKVAEAAATI